SSDRPSRCLLKLRFSVAARRFALRSLASALWLIARNVSSVPSCGKMENRGPVSPALSIRGRLKENRCQGDYLPLRGRISGGVLWRPLHDGRVPLVEESRWGLG